MSTAGSPAAESRPVQRIRAFGWRDKVGYLSGDVANNLTFYLQTAFFLIFYTNVMGIQAWARCCSAPASSGRSRTSRPGD